MKIGKNGLELIKKFEGFSGKPYLCPAKIPTIGWGNTYYENGTKVNLSDTEISRDRADALLEYVANEFASKVSKIVKVELTQNQFDALVSFAYNLGVGNLSSSTLLKKVNAGDMIGASEEFGKWVKAGGKTLAGLVTRRAAEKDLFLRYT